MAYDPIEDVEIEVKKPVTRALMAKFQDNFDYLYGALGTVTTEGLQNGSFEIDGGADNIPDGWTLSLYPGGTGGMNSTSAHGAKSFRFTHPGGAGNGGGYLESDYIPISEYDKYMMSWIWWTTVSGMHIEVLARYFDKDKVPISDESIFDTTAGATTPTRHIAGCNPVVGARFIKLRIDAGNPDTNVAGSIYFDGVEFGRLSLSATVPDITAINVTISAENVTTWIESLLATISVPVSNIPLFLSVPLTISWTTENWSGAPASFRMRVGSIYSGEELVEDTEGNTSTEEHTFLLEILNTSTWPILLYGQIAQSDAAGGVSASFVSNGAVTILAARDFNVRMVQGAEDYV